MRFLLLCACLVPGLASARPVVRAAALPTRRADFDATQHRGQALAAKIASKLGGITAPLTPAPPRASPSEWVATVDSAAALALDVKLGQAADLLDRALAPGWNPAFDAQQSKAWVTAHLARASIALARNEVEQVTRLLDRVVRFDPFVALLGDEDRPRMATALGAAKMRVSQNPQLTPEDVAGACRAGEQLILVRALDGSDASSRIEAQRFDGCRFVASATGVDLDSLSTALTARDDRSEHSARRIYWPALGLGIAAVAVAITGAGLAGSAGADYASLRSSCGQMAECAPASWQGARAREQSGYALIGIGAAAGITSLILWGIDRRRAPTMKRIVNAWGTPAPSTLEYALRR